MDYSLAIDVGTQSIRACGIDMKWSMVERQKVPCAPQVTSKDRVEMDSLFVNQFSRQR